MSGASISLTVESDCADEPAEDGTTVLWLSPVAVEVVVVVVDSDGAVSEVVLA